MRTDGEMVEDTRERQAGFALVLALLSLTLLTFLGLALSLSTTTELQIATNYRWSEQAFRNAEAGLDAARHELQQVDWRAILPPSRASGNMNTLPTVPTRTGYDGLTSRNFEGRLCDPQPTGGGVGYGIVLDVVTYASSFQAVNTYGGQLLGGTFSVWIRRPLNWNATDNRMVDNETDDRAIVTVEGAAPYTLMSTNTAARRLQLQNRAVRMLEATVQLNPPGCDDNDHGQTGQGATNSGYAGCNPFNGGGPLGADTNPTVQ